MGTLFETKKMWELSYEWIENNPEVDPEDLETDVEHFYYDTYEKALEVKEKLEEIGFDDWGDTVLKVWISDEPVEDEFFVARSEEVVVMHDGCLED